jgi:hypothetical protein
MGKGGGVTAHAVSSGAVESETTRAKGAGCSGGVGQLCRIEHVVPFPINPSDRDWEVTGGIFWYGRGMGTGLPIAFLNRLFACSPG